MDQPAASPTPTQTPVGVANNAEQARQRRDSGTPFAPGPWLDEWEKAAKAPQIYDPPQLRAGSAPFNTLNWATQRSPLCAPSCCGALSGVSCLKTLFSASSSVSGEGSDVEYHKISEPDEWFLKMLSTGVSPHCPEHMKGVWWMKDNLASEVLVTFQDMDWTAPRVGNKEARYNWTAAANTLYGTLLIQKMHAHFFQVSQNGRWINLGETSWIYVLDASDTLRRPDGTPVPFTPGEDMMRVTYESSNGETGNADAIRHDSNAQISYQYLVRRVAYKGPNGELVKTAAYADLLHDVRLPTVGGCCGNLCYSNLPKQEVMGSFVPLSDEQAVILAPPPHGATV